VIRGFLSVLAGAIAPREVQMPPPHPSARSWDEEELRAVFYNRDRYIDQSRRTKDGERAPLRRWSKAVEVEQ
jgi:hypothetical protein